MGETRIRLKPGMGGSNGGKGRTDGTEAYKRAAKKRRRQADKRACR